jgi:hypothetical protein
VGRSNARELIRAAQAAELDKDFDRAVALLREAAQIRLDAGEKGRALMLLQHCLRLVPGHAEIERLVHEIEPSASEPSAQPLPPDVPLVAIEPLVVKSGDEEAAPAGGVGEPETEQPEPAPRACFELPRRGPTAAAPDVECWCSFCCRPKAEVGPMVAGPAGAFICAECIGAAAAIAGVAPGAAEKPSERVARALSPDAPLLDAEPPPGVSDAPAAAEPMSFVEAAVRLSRALGWSLDEVRSLSVEEREEALDVMRRLGLLLEG